MLGIVGGVGNDRVWGDNENNNFIPDLGANEFYAGGGFDRVFPYVYAITIGDTAFDRQENKIRIHSISSPSNSTQAFDIERLVFLTPDGDYISAVAFDTGASQNAGTAYRVYQAGYDRVPDAGGLGFWVDQLDNGLSFEALASYFLSSEEYINIYMEPM